MLHIGVLHLAAPAILSVKTAEFTIGEFAKIIWRALRRQPYSFALGYDRQKSLSPWLSGKNPSVLSKLHPSKLLLDKMCSQAHAM